MNAGAARLALAQVPAPVPPVPPANDTTTAPAAATQPAPPDSTVDSGMTWTRYAGKLFSALTVPACYSLIEKQGYQPEQPDDSEVDRLSDALEAGLRLHFGTAKVPWWTGCALAAGGVYASMRVGAKKLAPKPTTPAVVNDDPRPEATKQAPAPTVERPAAFKLPIPPEVSSRTGV